MSDAVERAAKLFYDFTGRKPTNADIAKVDMGGPDTVLIVGRVNGILYETRREGRVENYIHEFENSRPVLAVSSDGKQIYILAGGYKFTDRGFIG